MTLFSKRRAIRVGRVTRLTKAIEEPGVAELGSPERSFPMI